MMRVILGLAVVSLFFVACNKDKYTSAPQIEYKSLTFNFIDNTVNSQSPSIVFSITDSEGDLGDTATIHIKNLLSGDSIELAFPSLDGATKKNLKADVTASIGRLQGCITANPPGHLDTMYYEVYVVDFGKHKSNTIVTGDPVYQQCP
jgi:hypothetical protein